MQGTADLREIEPVCVLDFYVHESCQRQGVGKALFEVRGGLVATERADDRARERARVSGGAVVARGGRGSCVCASYSARLWRPRARR